MSNFLAIATATATLRQILDDAVSKDVNGASATAVRPNAPSNQLPSPGVNVYLYHVTPNAAWRNADVPTRSADGGLMQRPRTAIDLHYLLSFYGNEGELEPQRVLGSVIRVLHGHPNLPRQKVRDVINASAFLKTSNLDEEVELVKFTQLPLSLEELGKLWSVLFQTTHVLSVAFQGTVVLIEGQSAPRATLPVRERNLYVVRFRQPMIEQVAAAAGMEQPIIAASTLRITGVALRGNVTRVRIGQQVATPAPGQVSDTQIDVTLPAGLRAGIQSAQIEQLTADGHAAYAAQRGRIECRAVRAATDDHAWRHQCWSDEGKRRSRGGGRGDPAVGHDHGDLHAAGWEGAAGQACLVRIWCAGRATGPRLHVRCAAGQRHRHPGPGRYGDHRIRGEPRVSRPIPGAGAGGRRRESIDRRRQRSL